MKRNSRSVLVSERKFLLIESALRSIVGTSDDGMVSNLALVRLADRTVIWEEKGFRLEGSS